MRISTCLFLLSLISLLGLSSSQAIYNPGDVYALNNRRNDTQGGDEGSGTLRMAAKGDSHGSTATTDTISETSKETEGASATTTAATTRHGHGGKTSAYGSPAILSNGTLFYCALSITCLLWGTGRFIDYKTDRLELFTETNVHKL